MQAVLAVKVTTPLVQPVQPPNVEPLPGVAVKVTVVPLLYEAEQVPLQLLIPAGVDVTVPLPVPLLVIVFTTLIVSANCCAVVFETVTVMLFSAVELSAYTALTFN